MIDFLPRLLYNKTVQGRLRRQANIRQRRRFIRRFVLLPTALHRVTPWAAAPAAPACSGKQKNTACTRQAVQFVGRGDARRKERLCRDGTAIAAKAVKRKQTESVGTFLHEFLPIASHATRGVSRVCVFGKTKKHGLYKTSRAICWQGRREA